MSNIRATGRCSGRNELPVIDQTGLQGYFSFDLYVPCAADGCRMKEWSDCHFFRYASKNNLGFARFRKTMPVKMMVIDHLEHVPTMELVASPGHTEAQESGVSSLRIKRLPGTRADHPDTKPIRYQAHCSCPGGLAEYIQLVKTLRSRFYVRRRGGRGSDSLSPPCPAADESGWYLRAGGFRVGLELTARFAQLSFRIAFAFHPLEPLHHVSSARRAALSKSIPRPFSSACNKL